MPAGPDEDGGNPEDGPVLTPEELDIADVERVRELDEGRYVVSSGDPIAEPADEPAGEIEAGPDAAADRAEEPGPEASRTDAPSPPEPVAEPDTGPQTDPDSLNAAVVHDWLSEDLIASNSRYGFDITAAFDGAVAQQRMVSNDVVTIFESLVMWYAQQIDRNTPVEEVLGILLMEANVPIRYPPEAIERALSSTDLSADDSIADLVEAVRADDGFKL